MTGDMEKDRNGSLEMIEVENEGRDEYLAKWEIGILTFILIVTLLGNTLVLISLYLRKHRSRRKITRMYFFILHLSVADLLTGLLDVLPQLAWDITFRAPPLMILILTYKCVVLIILLVIGGALLCKVVKFLQPIGPYSSSYILTVTAIDRYHAICHPLSYCSTTSRRSRIMVYCAWTIAFALSLPQIFIFSYQEISRNVWDCWATFRLPYGERAYVTWYGVTVFLLPFVILVYTYTGICFGIWKSNQMSEIAHKRKSLKGANFLKRNRNHFISKALINTVKQTIAVISLYVITSTPFIGCLLWATWYPGAAYSSFIKGPGFAILTLLSSLTSCVNPWIYLSFNHELRSMLLSYCCREDDFSLRYDQNVRRSTLNDTSVRTSLISRMSRYAGSVKFR